MSGDNLCPVCPSPITGTVIAANLEETVVQYCCANCKTKWTVNNEIGRTFIIRAKHRKEKEARKPKVRKVVVICPICGDPVRANELEKHKKKHKAKASSSSRHSSSISELNKLSDEPLLPNNTKPKKPMTVCPICGVPVRVDNLERHNRKAHKSPSPSVDNDGYNIQLVIESARRQNIRPNLREVNLYKADLRRVDLREVDLCRANLSKANLSEADLSGADLRGAFMLGANLSGANLSNARLRGVDLSGLNLGRANLSGADLTWANLSKANLNGANLNKTYLYNANLEEAQLDGVNLKLAYYSDESGLGRDNSDELGTDYEPDYEVRDGSKYLGHFRRDHGQFGSFPLHDDYDDESDPE